MSQSGEYPPQGRRNRTTGPNALPLTPRTAIRGNTGSRSNTGPQTNIQPVDEEEDDFLDEPGRSNTSVVRYDTGSRLPSPPNPPTSPVYPRRRTGTQDLPQQPRQNTRRSTSQQFAPPTGASTGRLRKRNTSVHWLLPVGVGMVAMLVLWVFGSLLVAWGQQRYDDITYGMPRTYQTDAVVGHDDSPAHKSHFIAINYNRQAIVTEWMGGDPAKSVVYVVPYYIVGDNSNLTPVTVEFRDVTGDHRPDMIIHIHLPTQDETFVFVNDGKKFRPQQPGDKIQL